MIIIGVDPHPASHTAAALDAHGGVHATVTVANDDAGRTRLWQWAQQYPERRWAVEGASNPFTRPLTRQLLDAGERVHHIHPGLTSQYRSRRTGSKTDELDAECAARALLANPALAVYRESTDQVELQQLTRHRDRLARDLQALRMARRALDVEDGAAVLRESLDPVIVALQTAIKQIDRRLLDLVRQHAPDLLDQCGVGPAIAGIILAETGDITRFASRHQFARFCGAAPVPRGSGGTVRWCVSRGGNRRLNRALHLIALTRLRCDQPTRTYVAKRRALGQATRHILRNLKTVIARHLFALLQATSPPEPA